MIDLDRLFLSTVFVFVVESDRALHKLFSLDHHWNLLLFFWVNGWVDGWIDGSWTESYNSFGASKLAATVTDVAGW